MILLLSIFIFSFNLFGCTQFSENEFDSVEYLGLGYDVFEGNPLSDTFDGGFRDPIFMLDQVEKIDEVNVVNGNGKIIPSGMNIAGQYSCSIDFTTKIISTLKDYRDTLKDSVSVVSHIDNSDKYQSAFSESFKDAFHSIYTKKNHMTISTATCSMFQVNIVRSSPPELSQAYLDSIEALPERYDSDYEKKEYLKFINMYGTHIITKMIAGNRYSVFSTFTAEKMKELKEKKINIKYAASISAKIPFVSKNDVTMSKSKSITEQFDNISHISRVLELGVPPPLFEIDKYATWLSVTEENIKTTSHSIVPIWYEIIPIYEFDILTSENGMDGDKKWTPIFPVGKRKFFREAVSDYMLKIPQKMLFDSVEWYEHDKRCPDDWIFVDYEYNDDGEIEKVVCQAGSLNFGICAREIEVTKDTSFCTKSKECQLTWTSAGCVKSSYKHWSISGFECPDGWINYGYNIEKDYLTCRSMTSYNRGSELCPSVFLISKHFDRCTYARKCEIEWKDCIKYNTFQELSTDGSDIITANLNVGERQNKTIIINDPLKSNGFWIDSRKCPNHYFLTGFKKSKYNKTNTAWISDLRNIKAGYCQSFPSSMVRMECHQEEWEGKLVDGGKVSCNKGFAIRGFKKSSCNKPECIKKGVCCKSAIANREYLDCMEVDVTKKIEISKESEIKCEEGYFLTGLKRECDYDAGSLDLLSCVSIIKCCMLNEF